MCHMLTSSSQTPSQDALDQLAAQQARQNKIMFWVCSLLAPVFLVAAVGWGGGIRWLMFGMFVAAAAVAYRRGRTPVS